MKTVIDIGNTLIKLASFEKKELISKIIFEAEIESEDFKTKLKNAIKGSDEVLISSVRQLPKSISDYLSEFHNLKIFNTFTDIPIRNTYKTPESLGMDRLAASIGARAISKTDCSLLVIDMGSCITCDFVNNSNEYVGGSISPGLTMRFKALHEYTSVLPEVSSQNIDYITGLNTIESIRSGVINGIGYELSGCIESYLRGFPDLKVFITGGDHSFFASRIKFPIFASPDLVLIGLNEILDYNKT